jgi:hypothetical protein
LPGIRVVLDRRRHCEKRSDEAIQGIEGLSWSRAWNASHALVMTIVASI